MRRKQFSVLVAIAVVAAAGCGTAPPAGMTGSPSIAITSPAQGATLTGTTCVNPDVSVAFTTQNVTLMAPATCGTTPNCGHVHLYIDKTSTSNGCTDPGPPALPYASAGAASPLNAGFDYCASCSGGTPTASGPHTIRVELHHDDHSAWLDSAGTVYFSQIDVTVP